MKKIAAVFIAFILLAALCACGNTKENKDIKDTGNVTEAESEKPGKTVETPYCSLVLPADYEGAVKESVTGDNPYTLSFSTADGKVLLYSLAFGGEKGIVLGTLETEKENIVLYLVEGELDNEDPEYETYCAYQDEVNKIIRNLERDYKFATGTVVEYTETSDAVYDIETPLVTLKYPERWKEKVTANVTDGGVSFFCGETPLFEIVFGECEPGDNGYMLGTYESTPVYVIESTLDKDNLPAEEYDELYSMQDDVNVIYQYLLADSKFTG